jgi:hypothetical protein
MSEEKDPYKGLRAELDKMTWPRLYVFKFIVKADNQKVAQTQALGSSETSEIHLNTSKTGKFVSVTIKEVMMSPEEVIKKYEKASEIEGLIAL